MKTTASWHVRAALLFLLGGAAALPALAGGCSISSTTMAFGRYQPLNFAGKLASADRTSDVTVSVSCTAIATGGGYTIGLGPSSAGSSIVPRYLAHEGGGPPMVFNVFQDASFMSVWGDGFTGTLFSGSIPPGDSTRSHAAFGRIPGGQSALKAGSYAGNLTLTIRYNP